MEQVSWQPFVRLRRSSRRQPFDKLRAFSGQLADNKSLAFGVIKSLRSAVICCNRWKSEERRKILCGSGF